mgnify:CR=1 FL=1
MEPEEYAERLYLDGIAKGWIMLGHTISEEAGVSLSGFLEALASDMRDNPPDAGGQHPHQHLRALGSGHVALGDR